MSKKPAAALEASPPLWPWMLIAALVILIAFLLRLGAGGDDGGSRDPLAAGNGATVSGALEDRGSQGQEGSVAWTRSAATQHGGQAAYAGNAGTAGGAATPSRGGGISGWFSRFFGSDTASPTPGSAPDGTASATSGAAGGYLPAARVASANTNASTTATTAARAAPIRELPNEQLMQPGDDSAYLKDGAPGETAGDNSPD